MAKKVKVIVERKVVDGGIQLKFWAIPKDVDTEKYREKGIMLEPDNAFAEFSSALGKTALKKFLKMNGIYLTREELDNLINDLALSKDFCKKYNCLVSCIDILVRNGENLVERAKEVESAIVNWFKKFVEEAKKRGIFREVAGISEYDV